MYAIGDLVLTALAFSLLLLPIFGYFAYKNNWKIVDWF
jgi:hypothetical protein